MEITDFQAFGLGLAAKHKDFFAVFKLAVKRTDKDNDAAMDVVR